MDLGLAGRTALVCGGSRGLGFGCARALAAEGARIALAARGEERLATATGSLARDYGAEARGFRADLNSETDRERLIADVVAVFGRIDVLVTNNGGPPPGGVDQVSDEEYRAAAESTLLAPIHLTRLVLPAMRQRRWGRVIHLASISVKQPIPGLLLSNTFRLGLVGFARTVAAEVAREGVRVHVACPGSYDTDRIRELTRARARDARTTEETELAHLIEQIPVGRLGNPDELGSLVAFLASERADFLSGTVILADGGAYRGVL